MHNKAQKEEYPGDRRRYSQRHSIWEGVLDVNNVIMVPETPKWRSRTSIDHASMMEEGILDPIVRMLSPQAIEITTTSCECVVLDAKQSLSFLLNPYIRRWSVLKARS